MKPATPRFVTVAIFTTITIIFWIFYVIYEVLTSAPPVVVDPNLLEPIVPRLDTQTLESLSQKEFFEEGEEIPFSPLTEASPSPTLIEELETAIPALTDEETEEEGSLEPELEP
jgi:hypothetical protein